MKKYNNFFSSSKHIHQTHLSEFVLQHEISIFLGKMMEIFSGCTKTMNQNDPYDPKIKVLRFA